MRFLAYDLSLELIRGLREPLAIIRRRDPRLARQGTDAANSVVLNLGESNGRFGADRLHLCRIALGSLREVGAVLDIAAAHGWLESPPLALERDRLCGMLYGLQRR
jgi:four helix bundle protein